MSPKPQLFRGDVKYISTHTVDKGSASSTREMALVLRDSHWPSHDLQVTARTNINTHIVYISQTTKPTISMLLYWRPQQGPSKEATLHAAQNTHWPGQGGAVVHATGLIAKQCRLQSCMCLASFHANIECAWP